MTSSATTPKLSRDQADELTSLVYLEAQLIDQLRLQEWLALFTPDAHYWIPGHAAQTNPLLEPSLAYEDRLLLQIRIDRLQHPQAHSQKPPSRCVHVLQAPQLISIDGLELGANPGANPVANPRTEPGTEPATTFDPNSDPDSDIYTLRTPFTYAEQRADRQILLTGVARHQLTRIDGTLRIKSKRVDLLGADSALPMIQLFP